MGKGKSWERVNKHHGEIPEGAIRVFDNGEEVTDTELGPKHEISDSADSSDIIAILSGLDVTADLEKENNINSYSSEQSDFDAVETSSLQWREKRTDPPSWPSGQGKDALLNHVRTYEKKKFLRLIKAYRAGNANHIFYEDGHEKPMALVRRELGEVLTFLKVPYDKSQQIFAEYIEPITQNWVQARDAYKRGEIDEVQFEKLKFLLKKECTRKIRALFIEIDTSKDEYIPEIVKQKMNPEAEEFSVYSHKSLTLEKDQSPQTATDVEDNKLYTGALASN